MELTKNYIPADTEEKWSEHWMRRRYFHSIPDDRPAFTVVIPPPNVTGVLHMGHTLNETVQDILVRNARMRGFNACWVPGSDHASIATEAKVVGMLKDRGIDKNQLTRPEYMRYAYEWREKYGGIIYSQIRKLGCSVDWDRVAFTMDPDYYASVISVFVDLFDKGLIYRGARMINWDPQAKTALSDEEVEYRDESGKLYYVSYPIVDASGAPTGRHIEIATQRPETIMGDTAVCVNPADERYRDLAGSFALVPLVNRKVPIIFDEYVDPAFGTGALKVTPAHDINDYNLGLKHGLPIVDTLNPDGTLSEAAEIFIGMERFAARKEVISALRGAGLLRKEQDHPTRIGYSQRTNAVVEPRISTQWFVRMAPLAGPALKAVTGGYINIHPGEKFLATYKYWLENVKDWCISRQLWWGQQIPAWYAPDGSFRVAATREEAYAKFAAGQNLDIIAGSATTPASHPPAGSLPFSAADLRQDEDVLDTWFSSWLWPIEVFKGISNPGNTDINYYYPTAVLVTGQDIIFFWVARMIMAGLYHFPDSLSMEKRIPFRDVYFTGMVRDKQGRKMSKSLGNSPDLLDLIDKYGADAVRFGIMISSPAGNDLLFDEAALEQGRNFNNKLWNALKLVKMWERRLTENSPSTDDSDVAITWFEQKLRKSRLTIENLIEGFKLSEALKFLYSLIWDDFCSWFLEWVKPEYGSGVDKKAFQRTVGLFEQLLQLLHPFMPFITEEIYHLLREREEGDDLCIKQFVFDNDFDSAILSTGELCKQIITEIRNLRVPGEFDVHFSSEEFQGFFTILKKSVKARHVFAVFPELQDGTITVVVDKITIRVRPDNLESLGSKKEKLEKDLQYQRDFLAIVNRKLENQRFLQNARPEVVALEQKKKTDAEDKIRLLEKSLAGIE